MGHDPQPRSSGRPLVALVGALLSLAFFFFARPSDAPLALLVQVQPSNARVRVLHPGVAWTGSDEVEARGGEARFVDVPRGAGVRIVVAAPGFQPESQAVSLARRGEEQRVMFALRPETAALSVTSVPAGASLFLDGKEVGVAPLLVSSLVPGVHRLRATIAGHEDTTVDFTVIAGEQREILLSLPPTQPSSEPAALPVSSTQDEPPAGRARLRLRSTHTSRFLVGDFVLATGLETYVDVVPGQHRVGANAIDRGFKWQLVTVVEGEQREVAFSFVEDPLSRVYAAADPNEALHWIVKGGSVRGEGGYGEAVEYFRKALTMDPDNVSAHRELARTLPGIQDWQGALQHAERYLELDPAAPDADFTREVIAELKRRIAGLPFSWESK